MIIPGLVSITFRKLSPEQVCRLAADNGLRGIEWGGDIHVPAGDLDAAKRVATLTKDHDLSVAAYGSYYKLGVGAPDQGNAVIETAAALGSNVVRVWCGNKGSQEADAQTRRRVEDDARRMSELAAKAGQTIVCEWHGGTLTDNTESAISLLKAVDHPAFQAYWQPHQKAPVHAALADMDAALPWVKGLHVFQWHVDTVEREPLAEGEIWWPKYLEKVRAYQEKQGPESMYAMLEFVADDDPANLVEDAATLRRWLGE